LYSFEESHGIGGGPVPTEGLMNFSRSGFFALSMAVLLGGCASQRMGSLDQQQQPAPLPAAPAGQIAQDQLPPPPKPADSSQFPTAPGAGAAAPMDTASAEAGASDITAGGVAGVWNASVGGQTCRIATPQTKFGQGFRAGPLRCPAPLDGVKSWAVNGKQLALYDQNGTVLARLYASGTEKFAGQTETGQPIALTR
jgi:hypothetical protein